MSKCIVTGGCGFIGSHVVDMLINAGHEVKVIDDLSTGKEENLNPKAELIIRTITDTNTWIRVGRDYDYVFHLASLARIQPSIDDPQTSNYVNVNGTLRALEYCRKNNAKIIFSGSSSIYAGVDLPTNEDDAKAPKNPYALQKYICEQYIQLYGELYGLDYCILRYFNVYGERQILDGAYAALIGIFLDQRKNNQPLTITGDGEQRRDFTYVGDVVNANIKAMGWEGVFNIGTGSNYSVNEIADMISDKTKHISAREGEVRETLADNSRALAQGWKPTLSIEEWINGQTNPVN